jgi:hypothetical protein
MELDKALAIANNSVHVSQQFLGGGPWIVHGPGPNRQPKIANFETPEEAEYAARGIRELFRQTIAEILAKD